MTNILKESDIKIIFSFTDESGNPVDADVTDFEFSFWTKCTIPVKASLIDGVFTNCSLMVGDSSKLIVSLDAPNFIPGKLNCKGTFFNADATFKDNIYKVVANYELNITII